MLHWLDSIMVPDPLDFNVCDDISSKFTNTEIIMLLLGIMCELYAISCIYHGFNGGKKRSPNMDEKEEASENATANKKGSNSGTCFKFKCEITNTTDSDRTKDNTTTEPGVNTYYSENKSFKADVEKTSGQSTDQSFIYSFKKKFFKARQASNVKHFKVILEKKPCPYCGQQNFQEKPCSSFPTNVPTSVPNK